MAITDLTNTTWKFNDTLNLTEEFYYHYLNIQSNGFSYNTLYCIYNGKNYVLVYGTRNAYTSETNTWYDGYQTITITGGTDATNTKLISWLEANATQVVDKVLELNPFLTNIANAIRNKKGTSDKINAQDFASEIENLSDEESTYSEILRTNFGDDSIVDDKTSYELGYEAGSADALKDVTTLKGYLDITKSTNSAFMGNININFEEVIKYDDTSNVTHMAQMFRNNPLTSAPLLNTSNVITMDQMFYSCKNLTTIPELDTGKVTSMSMMFHSCTSLTTIPALNTSNVTSMSYMFQGCSSLTTIPELNTSKVTTMESMFYNCKNLTTIPELDTVKVTNMSQMFDGCSSLTTIPLLNTSKVTGMNKMFYNCTNLTSIPALDASSANYFNSPFYGCSNLKSILMYGMKINFDISSSTKFEASDLVTILNNLATVTSTRTLTMGATNLAKLTDEQKAIATNKGWTLA